MKKFAVLISILIFSYFGASQSFAQSPSPTPDPLSALRKDLQPLMSLFKIFKISPIDNNSFEEIQLNGGSNKPIQNSTVSKNSQQSRPFPQLARAAISLYNIVGKKCPAGNKNNPTVGYLNGNCIQKIIYEPELLKNNAISNLKKSIAGFNIVQSIGFIKTSSSMAGIDLGRLQLGYAKNYINIPLSSSYKFIPKESSSPMVGDIALWSIGDYGHMAIITKVEADNNHFEVVEANISGRGGMAIRPKKTITQNKKDLWTNSLLGFIRKI